MLYVKFQFADSIPVIPPGGERLHRTCDQAFLLMVLFSTENNYCQDSKRRAVQLLTDILEAIVCLPVTRFDLPAVNPKCECSHTAFKLDF